MSIEINVTTADTPRITFDEARKRVSEMNLINGFMFDSVLEDEEKGSIVVKGILDTVLDMDVPIGNVRSQKALSGLDSIYHGIRFDVCIDNQKQNKSNATIYDIEMEDRAADKDELPKRGRYYQGICDSKKLPSGHSYLELPDYVSITILSYDPFEAGDMYYEVSSTITTHPEIEYKDGIKRIFLYGKGKNNLKNKKEYGERLQEMLEYIVTGQVKANPCEIVTKMEEVVSETKKKAEVTERYMQRWDEIEHIKRDVREETRKIVTEEVTDTVNRLNLILIESGRLDDLTRAAKEPEYQKKLIEELLTEKDVTKS
ncbi:MAG: hypothetical protein II842_14405 [Butyrivibrio sp.]|nr:hypothetical protein [Butyrivibrio sp.]